MNSLNILSARVSPPQTPSPSRNNSYGNAFSSPIGTDLRRNSREHILEEKSDYPGDVTGADQDDDKSTHEETPLLEKAEGESKDQVGLGWRLIPRRISAAFIESIRWFLSTIAAPGVYLIACLYDERGHFAPFSRMRKLGSRRTSTAQALGIASTDEGFSGDRSRGKSSSRKRTTGKGKGKGFNSNSSSSGLSSESESDRDRSMSEPEHGASSSSARHTRSKSLQTSDEIAPARRSIRIKLHNEGNKTLILDLDETLIHSMAKGGRMSTGHMVEVKLSTVVGAGGNAVPGPQHPILYYVHKRPHCDDFLRRICKWYNLVIFTASVQEYADPVIDFLETERKFFSGRYYRQHCTYRHGAFIKDLSSVEPDLSKVMILDNSPLSYMFHQGKPDARAFILMDETDSVRDNAIPIEGWINDPTDNDLLHLVPLLEGLQYVTDVRALLALRGGEDGKHIA
ncbi:DNA-directed RNA polymerase III [Diplocarpon rosae]|nr:DNA-directed RNA polymerase III [Diplocarpon rosae]